MALTPATLRRSFSLRQRRWVQRYSFWAAISPEEGDGFIEFVLHAIRPGADSSDALDDEYVIEVNEAREIADSLISATRVTTLCAAGLAAILLRTKTT